MPDPTASPSSANAKRRLERWLPRTHEPLWMRLLIGIACSGTALLLRLPIEALLSGGLPFVFFSPAVTIAALRGGAAAAFSATVVAVAYFCLASSFLHVFRLGVALPLALFIASSALVAWVASTLRHAVRRMGAQEQALQESEARLRLLVRELEHRVKNSLALASALVKLTARHSDDLADFRRRFEPRLQALASAQTLLTHSDWREPDLSVLIQEVLAPYLDPEHPVVAVAPGAPFAVPVTSAVSLTLLLHELATNAVKHGALSVPGGAVEVSWRVEGDGRLARLEWSESGGPPVTSSEHKGFGSELFRILDSGGVEIQRRFIVSGVKCSIGLKRSDA